MPTIPTFFAGPTFQCLNGENVVIPAHSNGAVAAKSKFSGIRKTKSSSTTTRSEYPPNVCWFRCLSCPLYVWILPFSQYCSNPSLQLSHSRQLSTIQPTPAKSPTLNFVTPSPTLVIRPTISCPCTFGYTVPPHSLRAVCKSEWHTPQYKISISTSLAVTARRSTFISFKSASGAAVPKAFTV